MDADRSVAPLELAVRRLRDAEEAVGAARADVEFEAVAALRAGADPAVVSRVTGFRRRHLVRLDRATGHIPPR